MRILIIGGTKFIGPYVVKALHEKGHQLILFNRGKTFFSFPFPITLIQGERNNLLEYKTKLLSFSPDIVIDMIAYSENNAKQFAEIFCGIVQRVVVISSMDVYRAYDRLWKIITDKLIPIPLTEQAELRENFYPYRKIMAAHTDDWTYSYEKILVEKTIQSYVDLNSTILRLPCVYGPGDYSRIYPYLKEIESDQPIFLDENKANWRFSRGYVEDMAYAITLAALDNRTGNKIYNVGEEHAYSEYEWIQHINSSASVKWNNKITKVPQDQLPAHLKEPLEWKQDFTLDTRQIRNELNYKEIYSQNDSMRRSIEWLRTNKPK